ncbi:MAG: hypothetical protein FJ294_07440 [Planctomycetes bacterium]|nr:hypothetical protein [Planctomycetota bacterium]
MSLLGPRRRAEKALVAVAQEVFLHGMSTRKVDDLIQALSGQGIDRSRVSSMCAELDEEEPSLGLDASTSRLAKASACAPRPS